MHIKCCDYHQISREIEQLKRSNAIVAEVFAEAEGNDRARDHHQELDQIAEEYIRSKGASPAFKGYRGFPATLVSPSMKKSFTGFPASEN